MIIDPYFPPESYKGFRANIIHELFDADPNARSYHYALAYPPQKNKNIPFYNLLISHAKLFARLLLNYIRREAYPIKGNFFEYKFGITRKRFNKNKTRYQSPYPEHKERIEFLDYRSNYESKLACLIFLNVTYSMQNFLEKNNVPFAFFLFPGGGFGINEPNSDNKIRKLCTSKLFRKVIVTNKLAQEYLIEREFCTPEQIHLLESEGKFTEIEKLKPKQRYPQDKPTFDLTFVDYKYMPKGLDKGYDLFIETAKVLAKKYDTMRFHVVGGFDENEIDVTEIRDKIIFYGVRDSEFLIDFYSRMDIFLSPNQQFVLGKGKFDGFPLGSHAQFCGVALFVTDELKLNSTYTDTEIVIIKPELSDIVSKIEYYYSNIDALYLLSDKGQQKKHSLSGNNKRITELKKLIDNEL